MTGSAKKAACRGKSRLEKKGGNETWFLYEVITSSIWTTGNGVIHIMSNCLSSSSGLSLNSLVLGQIKECKELSKLQH